MRKLLSMILVLAMMMSMAVVTSSAASPDFGEVTVNLDRKFVFEKAMKGYGLVVGEVETYDGGGGDLDPGEFWIMEVLIVKDGSRFTVDGSYNANCTFIAHEAEENEYGGVLVNQDGAAIFNTDTQTYHTVTNGRVDDMFNSNGLSAVENIWFVGDGMYGSPYWIIPESQMGEFPLIGLNPSEETTQKSVFQSTATVTGMGVGDWNYNNFTVTVTNDTDCDDVSLFALMVVSDIVTVTPFSTEVPAYSTKDYNIQAIGHVGNSDAMYKIITKPEEIMDMVIIKFESVEDYTDFIKSIPVEAANYTSEQNAQIGAVQLCNSTVGNKWLRSVGLSRKTNPYVAPGENHSACVTLDIN